MKTSVEELAGHVGVLVACKALDVPRSTAYRWRVPPMQGPRLPRKPPARALSATERGEVLTLLNSERFVDQSPAAVHATLLDEEKYLCHPRTMYRILGAEHEVRDRRDRAHQPSYARPELLATAPNQVWTWDVTWLRGPEKYKYYPLYVILDLYSRFTPGWMLAHEESGELAARLLRETCERRGVEPGTLTAHADRGPVPKGKTVSQLLEDLDITRSLSRPRVSNDNPYCESQFHTAKSRPDFPRRFDSFEHALAYCQTFFDWPNCDPRRSGIAYLTPTDVYFGNATEVLA